MQETVDEIIRERQKPKTSPIFRTRVDAEPPDYKSWLDKSY